MVRHIYLCENSAEGIFSAIYRAYEEGYPHEHNEVVIDTEGRNMELFCGESSAHHPSQNFRGGI